MVQSKQNKEFRITADDIIFFDLDGTLVDTNQANFLSYKKAILSVKPTVKNLEFNPDLRLNRAVLK